MKSEKGDIETIDLKKKGHCVYEFYTLKQMTHFDKKDGITNTTNVYT